VASARTSPSAQNEQPTRRRRRGSSLSETAITSFAHATGGRQLVPDNLGHARVIRWRDCSLFEAVCTAPRRLEACGVPSRSCRRKLARSLVARMGQRPTDESRRSRGSV
jgi:hypothetical protein